MKFKSQNEFETYVKSMTAKEIEKTFTPGLSRIYNKPSIFIDLFECTINCLREGNIYGYNKQKVLELLK